MTATIVLDGVSLVAVVGAFAASIVGNVVTVAVILRFKRRLDWAMGKIAGLEAGLRAAAPDEKVSDA